MEIKKVGVLGCGLMGSGIAQVCAAAGFDVTVLEVEQRFLDKGFAGIEKSLAKLRNVPLREAGLQRRRRMRPGRGFTGLQTRRTWLIATLLLRPSLKMWTRRRRCMPRLMGW